MVMIPYCACRPPYHTIAPRMQAEMICTAGRNKALNQAARYAERYISLVWTPNSCRFASWRPRAFTTRTPVMFSLKAPVILEFIFRTLRNSPRMRLRNCKATMNKIGSAAKTTRAMRQLMYSMKAIEVSTLISAEVESSSPQVTRSATRSESDVTREIIQPTGVLL